MVQAVGEGKCVTKCQQLVIPGEGYVGVHDSSNSSYLLEIFQNKNLGEKKTLTDLLAVWNQSGNSLANFSIAISAMGPNKTTGLLKPAEMTRKAIKAYTLA